MQMDRVQSPVSTPARSDSLTPDISSSNLAHIAPATPPNKEQAFETPNGFSSPSRLLVALRSLLSVFYPLASPLMATPDSSEPAASSQERSRMSGTVNWGTATLMGVFAGLLYGGSKEATASVSKDAEVMLKLGSTPDKREQYRLMRDAMEKRFIRVARGSIVGGVRLGMFTAIFYGLQDFMADRRGVHDVFNVAGAGSTTAAMFGLILPGSMKWRARNVLLGSVLGAGICFPLGWLQLKLVEKANEEMSNTKSLSNPSERGEISTSRGVGAAIERLEASVRK